MPFDPDPDAVRAAFPSYQQMVRIGAGGQKVVYRAVGPTGEVDALKLIACPLGMVDERALREVQAASRVRGPTFAAVRSVASQVIAGMPCVAVREEFIDGEPLRIRVQAGRQPMAFVRSVATALLEALAAVEAARLVHRDIKPENIMIARDGRVVLIDFGIARHLDATSLTSSYAMMGPMTVGYCAPEQVHNNKRAISIRTDFFALGVVIYELVTGSNPFVAGCTSAPECLQRCLSYQPPPLSAATVPAGLDAFVASCLDKSPHRRPASTARARALLDAVQWG